RAQTSRAALRARRRAVPTDVSLDGEHLVRSARVPRRTRVVPLFLALDLERHSTRDGGDGALPVGPLVRGCRLWGPRGERRLAWAERVLRAGRRALVREHDRRRAARSR